MNLKRRIRGWIGGIAAVALVPGGVAAQVMTVAPDAFPARPITLIVPFPAGGPSDALARAIAQGMSIHLKQPIVVENISGASGTIGLAKLVKSAPDGYTLGLGPSVRTSPMQLSTKKLPYDPLADFDAWGLPVPRRRYCWRGLCWRRPICRNSSRMPAPTAPPPPMAAPVSARSRTLLA